MIPQPIVNIAEICTRKNISHAVVSPGSRSAPLTISFARHPGIKTWVIPDERSAGYIACGIAARFRTPVVVICTSGTAALNLSPAVAEAFYQQIPLLILTADRPPEWIDQYDNQTIRQNDLYGKHVLASYTLPVNYRHPDEEWHCYRIVSEAVNRCFSDNPGPVHINVPLREPFYPAADQKITYTEEIKTTEAWKPRIKSDLDPIYQEWIRLPRKLVVAGLHYYDTELVSSLSDLSHGGVPVVSDITSNLQDSPAFFRRHDIFLSADNKSAQRLQPDLLVTFGKTVLSKNLKLFLRKHKLIAHWHVQKGTPAADTFQSMTRLIEMEPGEFFRSISHFPGNEEFKRLWQTAEESAQAIYNHFIQTAGFGEFKAIDMALKKLPGKSLLHLANSMSVRYANYAGLPPSKNIQVYSNRGTSGIDGCNSFAVGMAISSGDLTVLITGDLAFFYDRNAFWHNYPLNRLRIILLNNHAGGIFRLIDGPNRQPELEEFFETRQRLNAANTATDFGFEYLRPDSEDKLNHALESFFEESGKGKLLEIETSSIDSKKIFDHFKSIIKTSYESEISMEAS